MDKKVYPSFPEVLAAAIERSESKVNASESMHPRKGSIETRAPAAYRRASGLPLDAIPVPKEM